MITAHAMHVTTINRFKINPSRDAFKTTRYYTMNPKDSQETIRRFSSFNCRMEMCKGASSRGMRALPNPADTNFLMDLLL